MHASDYFALVVLFTDQYLELAPVARGGDTDRLLKMAAKLPLELQMVLCNRIGGRSNDIILSTTSEFSFQWALK